MTLWEAAAPYADGGGRPRLFVEYRLLDVPPEQLESPHSLPLPPPGQPLVFNFRKGETVAPSQVGSGQAPVSLLRSKWVVRPVAYGIASGR